MRIRFAAMAASMLLFGVALGACGGDDKDSSGGGGSAAPAEEQGGALIERAKEKVAEFEAGPDEYPGPTEAFDPGTGKAAVMGCGFAAPVCAVHAKEGVKALEAMGWETPPAVDGEFSPQKQSAFLDRAVQQGLDGVIMFSVDVSTIKPAVDRSIKAGLNIVCVACISEEYQTEPTEKGWVYDVTVDFLEQGQMNAWAVLALDGEDSKVAVFTDPAFDPQPLRRDGFKELFTQECPDCPLSVTNFATADIAKPGPPQFNALLAKEPKGTLTAVVTHYEAMGVAVARTSKQAGRDELSVTSYDTSAELINEFVDGPVKGAPAAPWTYGDWAAADMLGRLKAGLELWPDADSLPSTLVTPSNAENFLPPRDPDPTPEGEWRDEFLKVWQKK